jgi:hypothetical protein
MIRAYSYIIFICLLSGATTAIAYPLDGESYTGISRLEGYRLIQEGKIPGRHLKKGALLNIEQVNLRLQENKDLTIPAVDEQFKKDILAWLGKNKDKYALSVLDLSQPGQPCYAEYHGSREFNPGSVGKLMVAVALFQELADIYPDDIAAREQVLRNSMIVADRFIRYDEHDVAIWNAKSQRMIYRPLKQDDVANLWSYLDWMLSASSNAAASMVMKQVLLLEQFGVRYPVSESEANVFIKQTPRAKLGKLLADAMQRGVIGSGLNPKRIRQGKFFTSEGKRRIPGLRSYATPRELMRFLLHLEQGKVVDAFSSREIKRLMYMTQKRIRYASHPALNDAAVYFKSGSLYGCRKEAGFKCEKYKGNALNLLNSVAIIESPAGAEQQLFYLVVVSSNVLKDNSSVAHQTLALRLQRLIEKRHRARRRTKD